MLAFAGRLWTWVGNRIVSWDGTANGRWVGERLEGQTCLGATVAGGFLVLTLIARNGNRETWATDGDGWWLIETAASVQAERISPANLAGCGGWDVAVFRNGSATYARYRLEYRAPSAHTYPAAGAAQWTSSLLDAGQREVSKTWRRAGAGFAWPEGRGDDASADAVDLFLDYSLDGGATWAQAATATVTGGGTRLADLEGALPAGSRSRWLQIRVRWDGVADWAPTLSGVWADWSVLPAGAARRRWELTIRCGDRLVRRDGAVETQTGRQLAADLWAAWDAGALLDFRDIDADAADVAYAVRIVAIRETAARPADAGRWGESEVALTLVED
ncbi:MAG TPA: hypothetical protein VFQ80_00490 [Thermomicrobiales bacterium]|nr:hypothetical protein [Thermomicrobiales bacterium]